MTGALALPACTCLDSQQASILTLKLAQKLLQAAGAPHYSAAQHLVQQQPDAGILTNELLRDTCFRCS